MNCIKKYISYNKDTNVLMIYDREDNILYYNIKHKPDAKIIVIV